MDDAWKLDMEGRGGGLGGVGVPKETGLLTLRKKKTLGGWGSK